MKKELVLSRESILSRVQELAKQISTDYDGKEPVLVGILNGVVFFFADLVRHMTVPSKIDFIRATSYGSGMSTSGEVRFTKGLEMPITGRDVILVEDIIDSGHTLEYLVGLLQQRNPASLRIMSLLDKPDRREVDVPVDWTGFSIPNEFVVGYGLDYDEIYRNLPYIGVLKPSVYTEVLD